MTHELDRFAGKSLGIKDPQQSTNLGVRSSNLFGRAMRSMTLLIMTYPKRRQGRSWVGHKAKMFHPICSRHTSDIVRRWSCLRAARLRPQAMSAEVTATLASIGGLWNARHARQKQLTREQARS